ncbi:hypothetical protein ZIOFF_031870 [Zingiber officinale]|uniref:Piwi domain-containing protein n=1 Tax=Zingiber officinale TaxID=94328 RepID=A0A8J5GFR0_ZINOF|nr:hypothetical protein ZIOFF_031870 [Zingiber officinale]
MDVEDKLVLPGNDHAEKKKVASLRAFIKAEYLDAQDVGNVTLKRVGVSESQFIQVLNIELDQIIKACKFLDEQWYLKFTLIIVQKNHHTKFFLPNSPTISHLTINSNEQDYLGEASFAMSKAIVGVGEVLQSEDVEELA